jgi:hypothetical protein
LISAQLASQLDFFLYLPALDGKGSEESDFIDATSLMYDRADILGYVCEDLGALLRLDFVRFWSQVLHDDSLFKFLDTYLWYARHEGRAGSGAGGDLADVHAKIRRRVFLTIVRMGTYRYTFEATPIAVTATTSGKHNDLQPPLTTTTTTTEDFSPPQVPPPTPLPP